MQSSSARFDSAATGLERHATGPSCADSDHARAAIALRDDATPATGGGVTPRPGPSFHKVAWVPVNPQQSSDDQPTTTPDALMATATLGFGSSGLSFTIPPAL